MPDEAATIDTEERIRLREAAFAELEELTHARAPGAEMGRRLENLQTILKVAYGEDPTPTASPIADPPEQPVTAAAVTAYLRGRLNSETDSATTVQVIAGGFSKRTLLIDGIIAGKPAKAVIRQVPRGRRARSLIPEFDVLQHLQRHGFPVAEPLWLDPDDNVLGGPLIVSRAVDGRTIGDVWGPGDVSPELCIELAQLYAQLHDLPTGAVVGAVSPTHTREQLAEAVAWQRSTAARRGLDQDRPLQELFAWLTENLPAAPVRGALLHGDAAFSNLIIEGGRVAAVVDWERSHIGDPAEELAYLRPSVEVIVAWSDFLAHYEKAGGQVPHPDTERFYAVWGYLWRYVGCLGLREHFGRTGRYASAVAGYVHGPRFRDEALRLIRGDDQ